MVWYGKFFHRATRKINPNIPNTRVQELMIIKLAFFVLGCVMSIWVVYSAVLFFRHPSAPIIFSMLIQSMFVAIFFASYSMQAKMTGSIFHVRGLIDTESIDKKEKIEGENELAKIDEIEKELEKENATRMDA